MYWVCTECEVVVEKSRTKDIGILRRHIGKTFKLTIELINISEFPKLIISQQ